MGVDKLVELRKSFLSLYRRAANSRFTPVQDSEFIKAAKDYIDDFVRNDYHGDSKYTDVHVNGNVISRLENSARTVKAQVINVLKKRPYLNNLKSSFPDMFDLENWEDYFSEPGNF